jgi:predicted PurR-regulated permease PerM
MSMRKTWSRPARYLALIILLLLGAVFIYAIREIIGPLVIAALLAYVLQPLVAWFDERTKLSRRSLVFIVFAIFFLVFIVLPAALTPLLLEQISSLEHDLIRFRVLFITSFSGVDFLGYSPTEQLAGTENFLSDWLHPEQLFGALRAATENVIWILVILITTYYLMLDGERLQAWLVNSFPPSYRSDVRRLMAPLSEVWRYFLRGQLLTMLIMSVVSGVAALLIGLPGFVAVALLALVLSVLPSVGSSIMIGIVAIIALFADSNLLRVSAPIYALIAAGVFTAIHLFENYWLRPRILGRRMNLHPGLILIAIIGALTLGGILEALLIVPIIRSGEILGRYLMRRILAVDPWTSSKQR